MSKSDETASGGELGAQSTASVYDFLHNDSRRIGSYLAQLDDNGLMTEVRRGEQASKNTKRGFSIGGQVLGTGGNLEWTPKEGGGESAERVYDPFWANARHLLDALHENGMIHRGLEGASIGGMVLVTGSMEVMDLGLLKEMWKLPTLRQLVIDGATKKAQAKAEASGAPQPNRQARRAQGKGPQPAVPKSQEEQSANLMLEMMPVLPHSLNLILSALGGKVWANLREEHLVGTGSDLVLKHGRSVPGQWHLLGILDARPDLGGQGDQIVNSVIDFSNPALLLVDSLASQFARIASPIVRIAIGRPGSHYGITPLLIFREVGHAGI